MVELHSHYIHFAWDGEGLGTRLVLTLVCLVLMVTHSVPAHLRSIQENIQVYTNTLYRACANASPQDMNDAMIGVSNQVNVLA